MLANNNCLPMTSKANSTHGFLISSPLVANVWHSMKSFHHLSLSRLECPKAVFLAQAYSSFSSMISLTPSKILFIYWVMTPPSAMTSLILQTGGLQPLPSLQTLKKIASWTNLWNVSFIPDKSLTLTLTISLQKDCVAIPLNSFSTFC